jgi:hypothetical protein
VKHGSAGKGEDSGINLRMMKYQRTELKCHMLTEEKMEEIGTGALTYSLEIPDALHRKLGFQIHQHKLPLNS